MSEEQRGMLASLEEGLLQSVKEGRITPIKAYIISKQWNKKPGPEIEELFYNVQSNHNRRPEYISQISQSLSGYVEDGIITQEEATLLNKNIQTKYNCDLQDIIHDINIEYPNIPDSLISMILPSNEISSRISCNSNR